jgi:2'-5' RNA ligase
MSVAITLRLDPTTASKIDALVEALPDRRPAATGPAYPPHIKLATYGDSVDVSDLDAALATSTGAWEKLGVTLAGIGVFPGDPPALCLLPAPTTNLLGRHTRLHKALADLPPHPLYQVGAWVPHVMLGHTELVGDAIEVLAALWSGPIVGLVDSLDLVRFDPTELLSSRPLRG